MKLGYIIRISSALGEVILTTEPTQNKAGAINTAKILKEAFAFCGGVVVLRAVQETADIEF